MSPAKPEPEPQPPRAEDSAGAGEPAPLRLVYLTLDGVTYRYGHRDALQSCVQTDAGPGPAEALALAEASLGSLDGEDLKLRAGWLGLRWLTSSEDDWDGPGYLFSFDSSEPGVYTLEPSGEDSEPWELPV